MSVNTHLDTTERRPLAYCGPPSVLVVALLTLFPLDAHAYLDPGAGSYLLQVMTAVLFGTLFTVKVYWRRLTAAVRRIFLGGRNNGGDEHT